MVLVLTVLSSSYSPGGAPGGRPQAVAEDGRGVGAGDGVHGVEAHGDIAWLPKQ